MLQSLSNYLKLVISQHPTKQIHMFAQGTFFKEFFFFFKNISDITNLHNEKNQSAGLV